MNIKKILSVCILMCLLNGCAYQIPGMQNAPMETVIEEKSLYLIFRLPQDYAEANYFWEHGASPSETDIMDDGDLQDQVREFNFTYPLSEDSEITSYAWQLYNILVSDGRIDSIYIPYSAVKYTDGIWEISFAPEEYHGAYHENRTYVALISVNDGHIIKFASSE